MNFLLVTTAKVSVIVLVALAAVGLFRRRSAAWRHWVLAAVFSGTVVDAFGRPLTLKIKDVRPVFPASLKGTGTSGIVLLKGTIATDGSVQGCR